MSTTPFDHRTTDSLHKELGNLEDLYGQKFAGLNNHVKLTEMHRQIQMLKEEIKRRMENPEFKEKDQESHTH